MQEGNELARQSPETASQLMKMDHEEEEFAVRLEEAMRQQGVDQAELARRLGIGQSAISMMMKRECRPQRRTITRRVEALSVLPDDLWPGFSTR
jgi:predicted XRE-type DNA-binding protein